MTHDALLGTEMVKDIMNMKMDNMHDGASSLQIVVRAMLCKRLTAWLWWFCDCSVIYLWSCYDKAGLFSLFIIFSVIVFASLNSFHWTVSWTACNSTADFMYAGTVALGCKPYKDSQEKACICDSESSRYKRKEL